MVAKQNTRDRNNNFERWRKSRKGQRERQKKKSVTVKEDGQEMQTGRGKKVSEIIHGKADRRTDGKTYNLTKKLREMLMRV